MVAISIHRSGKRTLSYDFDFNSIFFVAKRLKMKPSASIISLAIATLLCIDSSQASEPAAIGDEVIAEQRENLSRYAQGKGYGPQSPRDVNATTGENVINFGLAPSYSDMYLCNIHFHKNAEHKGSEFNIYAGNGDGQGSGTGYVSSQELSPEERAPFKYKVANIDPGDTIEVHYVFSTAKVKPGPTLGACLADSTMNPQLRVEAQVFVVVNDDNALDFVALAEVAEVKGRHQAINMPNNSQRSVQYTGSTTGPKYNEKASPFQVTWSVQQSVNKVSISSIKVWLDKNIFEEKEAHGVRNLVINKHLLSTIK